MEGLEAGVRKREKLWAKAEAAAKRRPSPGLIALVILVLAAIVYPLPFEILKLPFWQHLVLLIFLFATLGLAWNIIGGYCGQFALGNAVFFGIGAYTATVMSIHWRITPWIGMLAGALIAAGVALAIGIPCFRLRGHYFAIATIAVGEIVSTIAINWDLVGGAVGLYVPLIRGASLWEEFINLEFHRSKLPYYYIALAMLAVALFVCYRIERSRLGIYLRAIKADQEGAESIGIDSRQYKLIAFGISAAMTAAVGTFFAQYVLFIDPFTVLPVMLSIMVALMAVLGGVGTLWGPVLGAAVLVPLSESTRVFFAGAGGAARAVDLLVYGALIVIIAVFQPTGLMGLIAKLGRKG